MKNIKSVSSSGCSDCQHTDVCMYKPLMVEAVESLQTEEVDATAPFEINIKCTHKKSAGYINESIVNAMRPRTITLPETGEVIEDIDKSSMYDTKMIQMDVFNKDKPNTEENTIVERRLK